MASQPKASTSESQKEPETERKITEVAFPPAEKSNEILSKLHANRKTGEFCDVQIKFSSTKTVHAHKSLLAICSPYFEGMFSSAFVEATSDIIDLSHMCDRSDVLEQVLDTFYGHQFVINESNVSDALNLANMLLMDDLKENCLKVLLGVLGLHNVAEMLQLAINYELHDLIAKVEPIVRARFHDFILFQDDIFHLSVQGFDYLLDIIDTSFITRREAFIQFILKWYNMCITEERAAMLKKAIHKIHFKLTKHSYIEYKDQLEDVLNHLDDANTALSAQTKMDLRTVLVQLIPIDYAENSPLSYESTDSDIEMEPEFIMYPEPPVDKRPKSYGPPTKETGFTREEIEKWKIVHKELAKQEENRKLRERWPPSTRNDPNRPKGIVYELPKPVLRTRKFEIKSPEELSKLDKMVEAVIVLAPSTSYIRKLKNRENSSLQVKDETFEVCAYLPCTKAWYKICDLNPYSIKEAFSTPSKPSRSRRPVDSDDEDEMEMMFMGMDLPEMMRGSPRSHRMLREMARSGMPPRMMHAMMDRDPDFYHEYFMMGDFRRMHHRHDPRGMGMMRHFREVRSLDDKQWKVQYFKHNLFFIHPDYNDTVYCYDFIAKEWYRAFIEYRGKGDRDYIEIVNGLDCIVMGDKLYAVLRVAMVDRRDFEPKLPIMRNDDTHKQNLKCQYFVYKLIGEKKEMKFEHVMTSYDHNHVSINLDKEYQFKGDEEHRDFPTLNSYLRQPNSLDTTLYAENAFTLYVITLKHDKSHKSDRAFRSIASIEVLYLDIKEHESVYDGYGYTLNSRTVSPLVSNDIVAFVDDHLKFVAAVNTMEAYARRGYSLASHELEPPSEFMEASEKFPECHSIMCSTKEGRRLWILRGKDDNSSEMVEVSANIYHGMRDDHSVNQKYHTPPPVRSFAMATAGKMNISMVKTFGMPLKFLHET